MGDYNEGGGSTLKMAIFKWQENMKKPQMSAFDCVNKKGRKQSGKGGGGFEGGERGGKRGRKE